MTASGSTPSEQGARRRSSRQVRELVLASAREAFADRAFDDVSAREIAERAGVTPATLFRHFGSKRGLFDAVRGDGDEPDRPDGDARQRILDAARQLFAAQGYAKTTTRDIARLSRVHEKYLYRYFDNKANLFRESILEPFASFVGTFGSELPQPGSSGGPPVADPSFVGGLFSLLHEHRSELLTLVATRMHEGSDLVDTVDQRSAMAHVVDPLSRAVEEYCAVHKIAGVDPAITTRLVIAMIGGVAIFDDWLFPDESAVAVEDLVREMVGFVSAGFARRAIASRG